MGWKDYTSEWYESYKAKHSGIGKCALFQKQQDAHTRKVNHKSKKAKVDGKMHPKYRLTIVLRYSQNRQSDIDGATSTILDCLQRAAQRLSAVDTGVDYPF